MMMRCGIFRGAFFFVECDGVGWFFFAYTWFVVLGVFIETTGKTGHVFARWRFFYPTRRSCSHSIFSIVLIEDSSRLQQEGGLLSYRYKEKIDGDTTF
jgi:hypothetical protein